MRGLIRLLLRLHPPPWRERFGPEVEAQALDDCRRALDRSAGHGIQVVAGTCWDLLTMALAERWRPTWTVTGADPGHLGQGRDMLESGLRDLRHAFRGLRKSPGFTAAAVGTLALALGVNAAVFSVVDTVLLRPLPYEQPERLVYVAGSAPGTDMPPEYEVGAEVVLQYGEHARTLSGVGGYDTFTGNVRVEDRVERLRQAAVLGDFFGTLRVRPEVGRLPAPGEADAVVLISWDLWQEWFAGDPGALGQVHEFAQGPREIIGVMPPDFAFPDEAIAWLPTERRAADLVPGNAGAWGIVARMAAGADEATVTRELTELARNIPEAFGGSASYAEVMANHVPVVQSLHTATVGPVQTALWLLLGAVGVVLLIACANVASLFAVRAEGRGRDLAVRKALGAGRGALLRSQMAEAALVGALGGTLALVLGNAVLPLVLQAAPAELPRLGEIRITTSTVLFTAFAAAAAALACGLLPALSASRADLNRLRDGIRGSTRRHHWGRDALVVGQTALSLTLLVGSGLLLRSLHELRSVDPGFRTEGVVTFQYAPAQPQLTDGPSWAAFHLAFMDRLRALPGVERVGIVENMPLDEGLGSARFITDANPSAAPGEGPLVSLTAAGGDYFAAMDIDVLAGRAFTDDDARNPGNVVVSAAAAELLWPGETAVGRRLLSGTLPGWHTVVGVVEDVQQYDLRATNEPMVYFPMIGPEPGDWALSSPGYVVRTDRGAGIVPDIRALVREVAPEAPMYRVFTMEALVDRDVVQLSFAMLAMAAAAGLALLLGAVGLYGILSYVVAERTREIGVRMALGAEAGAVRRMVVGQGLRVVGIGIAIGLLLAFAATRALSSLLYGVEPLDPATFAFMALTMAAVGLLASWIPAHRAARVDPVTSMRAG